MRSGDGVYNAFSRVMDEILRDFFVSRILVPSRDVMLVNYCLVNEKMVDKVNIKIVSTMLNGVRSILADTIEPEAFKSSSFTTKTYVNIN